jgi:type II secretory pathway pseudopilin PulG
MSKPAHLRRSAFTLVEALVAISFTATAASVLLLAVTASQQTTDDALERLRAAGMAEQLMDEILGQRYCADPYNGYETSLSRSAWEAAGPGRSRNNDIDDYNGVRTQPPTDLYGIALGSDNGEGGLRHAAFRAPARSLDSWRQEVDVYYVAEGNLTQRLTGGQVSNYRVVEVRITKQLAEGRRELAKLRRVVAYAPPLE